MPGYWSWATRTDIRTGPRPVFPTFSLLFFFSSYFFFHSLILVHFFFSLPYLCFSWCFVTGFRYEMGKQEVSTWEVGATRQLEFLHNNEPDLSVPYLRMCKNVCNINSSSSSSSSSLWNPRTCCNLQYQISGQKHSLSFSFTLLCSLWTKQDPTFNQMNRILEQKPGKRNHWESNRPTRVTSLPILFSADFHYLFSFELSSCVLLLSWLIIHHLLNISNLLSEFLEA